MLKLINTADYSGLSGAMSDSWIDCHELAKEVFGEDVGYDAGLLAFSYMFRRFGPSIQPIDDYKELARYVFSTEDPEVFLGFSAKASGLSFFYLATKQRRSAFNEPSLKWESAFRGWFQEQNPDDLAVEKYWGWRCDAEKCAEATKVIGDYPLDGGPIVESTKKVLVDAMRDLLRPTYIRDVHFNILGVVDDEECEDAVEYFKVAT